MMAVLGDDRFGALCLGGERFHLTGCAYQPVADLWISPSGLVSEDAWICRPSEALIVRGRIGGDGPIFLRLSEGTVSPAIGGIDLTISGAVVALRVICDGAMTYVPGRLRLDMATSVVLLLGAAPDRAELDDRLCELAVELVRPGGYEELHSAGASWSTRRYVP
jgi:hypothetical protein